MGQLKKKDNPKKPATQGTQDEEKTKQKHNPICIGHHHTQTRHTFMPQQLEVKTNRTSFL
jgi:hypothetical protein